MSPLNRNITLRFACLAWLVAFTFTSNAQNRVSIGTPTIDPSAVMEISSTDQGILTPRMSLGQILGIANPATSLLAFDTFDNGYWFFDGSEWVELKYHYQDHWKPYGNFPDDPSEIYVGTSDDVPFSMKWNNTWSARLDHQLETTLFGTNLFSPGTIAGQGSTIFGSTNSELDMDFFEAVRAGFNSSSITPASNRFVAIGPWIFGNRTESVHIGVQSYNVAIQDINIITHHDALGANNPYSPDQTINIGTGRDFPGSVFIGHGEGYFNNQSTHSVMIGADGSPNAFAQARAGYVTCIGHGSTAGSVNYCFAHPYSSQSTALSAGSKVERCNTLIIGSEDLSFDYDVGINDDHPDAQLEVNGYSKLGELGTVPVNSQSSYSVPSIKMKKITGMTPAAQGGILSISHGVGITKIISVDILVEYSAGGFVPKDYTINPGYEFTYYAIGDFVYLALQNGNSSLIVNDPFKMVITYME